MGIDGLTPADCFFGRADQVLAQINALSRHRQGVLQKTSPSGSAIEELVPMRAGNPMEVLRLMLGGRHVGTTVLRGPSRPGAGRVLKT